MLKGGGEKSDRHAITASDMFRPIQATLSYLLRQFSIRARKVVFGPCSVFDEDIFDLPTSLSRSLAGLPAISHKREAFCPPLTAVTIAAANLEKVLMELTSGGRGRLSGSLARSTGPNLAGAPRHGVAIIDSLGFCKEPVSETGGENLVVAAWWKISANTKPPPTALDGLQQNVSCEQPLNQLCLALGGPQR